MTERLLRVADVAERLGISRTTAYEMCMTGELPRVKVRTAVRVPERALADWIEQHTEHRP